MGYFGSFVKLPAIELVLQLIGIEPSFKILFKLPLHRFRVIRWADSSCLDLNLLFLSSCPLSIFLILNLDSLFFSLLHILEFLLHDISIIWNFHVGWYESESALRLLYLVLHRKPRAKYFLKPFELLRSDGLKDILTAFLFIVYFNLLLL